MPCDSEMDFAVQFCVLVMGRIYTLGHSLRIYPLSSARGVVPSQFCGLEDGRGGARLAQELSQGWVVPVLFTDTSPGLQECLPHNKHQEICVKWENAPGKAAH